MGTNALTGTIGIIDYTGFDVDASGNLDALGTITSGSGNTAMTDATGNVLHDALVDCADTQILKWATGGGRWGCAADATSAGGGIATIEENDVTIVSSATNIDFLGTDFVVGAVGAEGNISIDYTNSGITRNSTNETITGDWAFTMAAAESLDISSDLATAGTLNVASITGTPSATNGTIRGLAIINALSANANGIDTGLLIDNADDTVAIGTGINITSSGGGTITTGIDLTATAIGTGISLAANDIVGTTGLINYTNFDVDAAGGITVAATEGLDTNAAGALELGKLNATSVDICNSAACDTINIGNLATTDADTIVIGDALDDVSITDANWSITGAGVLTVASCVGCGGSTTRSLSANHAIASTTGTEVTNMGPVTLGTGTYVFRYSLIDTTSSGTVSPAYAVNFTGTAAVRKMTLSYPSTGTTAITGLADDVGATTGQIMETVPVTAFATSTANMLHTGGQTVTNNVHKFIDGIMIVTAGGDLELWHASETATTTTLIAGSSVVVTKIGAGSDLAEIYGTKDITIETGDVVSLDSSLNAGVKKSDKPYDSNVFGIISTSPGLVMGSLDDPDVEPVLVAFSGRVPVKVNTENGPIVFGDLLTSSSTPGVAMKATKAGQIIGQAMTEFSGEGVGRVLAFIKTDYGNGIKLADYFPGLTEAGDGAMIQNKSKALLSQFLEQKEQLVASVNLSEITTDRLMAGLEIITPRLVADNVETNTISSSEGKNLGILLGEGGILTIDGEAAIENEDGTTTMVSSPVITFDSTGNANFAGKLTAGSIEAGTIRGMDAMVNKISLLSEGQEALSLTASAIDALNQALVVMGVDITDVKTKVGAAEEALAQLTLAQTTLSETQESYDVRIKTLEDALASHSLTQDGDENNNNANTKIDSILNGGIKFGPQVEFTLPPVFNKDTAGFAIIKKDSNKVEIVFDNPYIAQPVVNTSISFEDTDNITDEEAQELFNQNVQILITNKTQSGFIIRINKNAPRDIRFSWTALAVKDAKIFESVVPGLIIEVPSQSIPPDSTETPLIQKPAVSAGPSPSEPAPEIIEETMPSLPPDTSSEVAPESTPEPSHEPAPEPILESTPEPAPEPELAPTPELEQSPEPAVEPVLEPAQEGSFPE
ncbi:MAG: hypothetical protein Q7S10_00735 [bacterium]|nr:hypothetical protein [bacterium]